MSFASADRRILALAAGLGLLNLWRLAAFRFFPSEDGPIHLEIAMVLDELWRGGGGAIAEYFRLNPTPQPNWLVYLVLAPLSRALGHLAAEKVLLAGYVVLLPTAFAYALGALRRSGGHWLLLAFPLTFNYLTQLGFYNFSYSLPLLLWSLGYWLRWRDRLTAARAVTLGLLLLGTAVAHAVSLGTLLIALGLLAVWSVVFTRLPERLRTAESPPGAPPAPAPGSWWRELRRRLVPLVLASLPAVALSGLFFTSPTAGEPVYRMPLVSLVKVLGMLHSLVSYDRREIALSVGLALLLVAAAAAALRRRWRDGGGALRLAWSDGLVLVAAALLLLYFTVPMGFAGGSYFSQRIQLHLLLLAILWLADQPPSVAWRRVVVGAAVALALGWAVLHGRAYARLDGLLAEYTSLAPRLEPGSTVLSLSFVQKRDRPVAPGLVFKVQPFMHAAGYLAAERKLVDLALYQADRGYFPILYRDERNPYRHLGTDAVAGSPARLDPLGYERTGGRVDYVVLWGLWGARRERADVQQLLEQLERGYQRVAVTAPLGVGELWQRSAGGLRETSSPSPQAGDGKTSGEGTG